MTEAEAIVVGGGPAGSTCAWKLREAGIEALVLDKEEFPRTKPCAGWITPRVVRDLELESYPHGLTRFDKLHFHIRGRRLPLPTRQYAIRRIEFDDWLLKRAGVPVHHIDVTSIRREAGSFVLEDSYRCTYLVGAGGTHCPVYRMLFREVSPRPPGAQIAALEDEFPAATADRRCHLWFFEAGLPGYSWFVPKSGGYLNIGIGGLAARMGGGGDSLRTLWERFLGKLSDLSLLKDYQRTPRGYTYFLRHAAPCVQRDNAFLVGDAAGLATADMGEGIGPAVRSGLLAAEAIARRRTYSLDSVPRYSVLDLMFPWRM